MYKLTNTSYNLCIYVHLLEISSILYVAYMRKEVYENLYRENRYLSHFHGT